MGRSQLKPPLENLRYASTRAEHVLLPTPQTDFFSVSLSLSRVCACVYRRRVFNPPGGHYVVVHFGSRRRVYVVGDVLNCRLLPSVARAHSVCFFPSPLFRFAHPSYTQPSTLHNSTKSVSSSCLDSKKNRFCCEFETTFWTTFLAVVCTKKMYDYTHETIGRRRRETLWKRTRMYTIGVKPTTFGRGGVQDRKRVPSPPRVRVCWRAICSSFR